MLYIATLDYVNVLIWTVNWFETLKKRLSNSTLSTVSHQTDLFYFNSSASHWQNTIDFQLQFICFTIGALVGLIYVQFDVIDEIQVWLSAIQLRSKQPNEHVFGKCNMQVHQSLQLLFKRF